MTFKEAKKLHNGDEVTVKEDGAVTTVLNIAVKEKTVFIDCTYNGFTTLTHKEHSCNP